MKMQNWFLTLAVILLVSFALVGCYTRFGLVHQETGYYEDEEISEAAEAEEAEQIEENDALPCCEDNYRHYYIHDRYFYDPWCWEPGFYFSIGFGWRYFDPYAYYPYWYDPYYYYPYVAYPYPWIYPPAYPVWYYEPGYNYAYNYERRPFVKRSQYLPARRGMNLNEKMDIAGRSSRRVELKDRNRQQVTTTDYATARPRTGDGSGTVRRTTAVKIQEKDRTNSDNNYGKSTPIRREVITSEKQENRNQEAGRATKEASASGKENSGKRETIKRGESTGSNNTTKERSNNSGSDNTQPKVNRSNAGSNNGSSGSGKSNSTVTRSSSGSGSSSSGSSGRSYSAPSSSRGSSSSGSNSVSRPSSGGSSGSSKSGSSGSGGRRR